MEKLVFATNNSHKLHELRCLLADKYEVMGLSDIGCRDDIPEEADTFEGNALSKAQWVSDRYGCVCAADDSGLCVDALGGAPGVHSARFAGTHGDSAANNALLLKSMEGIANRKAAFHTVIALVVPGRNPEFFHGSVEGSILTAPRGNAGFGYDPLFVPKGWSKTFAEATDNQKNSVSHRSRAVAALVSYLENTPSFPQNAHE